MYLLKKIISAFVLPPGIMVTALAVLAYYLRRRSRRASLACICLAALTWAGSCGFVSDALMRPLENAYEIPARPGGDVIIVLCSGSYPGSGYFSAGEALSPGTLEGASAAALLQKKTGLPVIISGGPAPLPESDAALAARYLVERGVPPEVILTEGASRDTFENAAFSLKICREKGYKKVLLVTSRCHMARSIMLFRKAGFGEVVPFPVGGRTSAGGRLSIFHLLPNSDSRASQALKEYLGLVFYRVYYFFL